MATRLMNSMGVLVAVTILGCVASCGREYKARPGPAVDSPPEQPVSRLRVLYVEGKPTWEYRALCLVLTGHGGVLTGHPSVAAQVFLLSAEPVYTQKSTLGFPALKRIPDTQESLSRYDVVVVGDLGAAYWESDGGAKFLATLSDYIRVHGGSVVAIAEESYRVAPGALAGILPVKITKEVSVRDEMPAFHLKLTPTGHAAEFLRLAQGKAANQIIWEKDLSPFYWHLDGVEAKKGASAYVVRPAEQPDAADVPVLVEWSAGKGRVLYIGTSLWQIRGTAVGKQRYQSLWIQMLRHMARE